MRRRPDLDEDDEHEILTRAAAIAFYAIAALVPFLALVITLTAWFLPVATWVLPWASRRPRAGRGDSQRACPVRNLLPADAASVLGREIATPGEARPPGSSRSAWSPCSGCRRACSWLVMDAMNRIMGVQETRPLWKVRLMAMLMTLSQAAILIVAFATTLAWPQILRWLGLSQAAAVLATLVHTVTVFAMILLSFAVANYFGPDADQRWEWITPGSLLGTLVLLCVSMLFRIYVQNWG